MVGFYLTKTILVILLFLLLSAPLTPPGETARAFARSTPSETDYPTHSLTLGSANKPASPIHLNGARNEHLMLLFSFKGARVEALSAELRKKDNSPGLEAKFYQLRPVVAPLPGKSLPDGLVPLEPGLLVPDNPVTLAASIKIPVTAPEGTYRYELEFRGDSLSVVQPLEVKIRRFSLDDDLPITIMANFNPDEEWFRRYGVNNQADFEKVIEAYLRSLREYKVNAISGFYPLPRGGVLRGRPLTNFPAFTGMLDLVNGPLGYRYFRLPRLPGAKTIGQPNSTYPADAKQFYSTLYQYVKSKGWERKAIVKVWDEPRPQQFPLVARAYALVKEAAPGLRTESAGVTPTPELARSIDIWAIHASRADPQTLAAAKQSGLELWLYANHLHRPDRPATHQRMVGWYTYRHSFAGYLFWGVNAWRDDPWAPVSALNPFSRRIAVQRTGTFYYPHPRTGMPLPNLRWEAMRRGWEDYQYLDKLAAAEKRRLIDPVAFKDISLRIAAVTENLPAVNPGVTWTELEDLRRRIGDLLDQAFERESKQGG
ncbi:MAG: DUF4091 domain-containing protein [Syntrophobacteraceae bacterium]